MVLGRPRGREDGIDSCIVGANGCDGGGKDIRELDVTRKPFCTQNVKCKMRSQETANEVKAMRRRIVEREKLEVGLKEEGNKNESQ